MNVQKYWRKMKFYDWQKKLYWNGRVENLEDFSIRFVCEPYDMVVSFHFQYRLVMLYIVEIPTDIRKKHRDHWLSSIDSQCNQNYINIAVALEKSLCMFWKTKNVFFLILMANIRTKFIWIQFFLRSSQFMDYEPLSWKPLTYYLSLQIWCYTKQYICYRQSTNNIHP